MTPPDTYTPIRILFLCTENAARSQIAEALLHRKGGGRFIVASAGTKPAEEIHSETQAALQTHGIRWRSRPKPIEAVIDDPWDLVITLCDRAREECPTLPTQPVHAHWTTPDPMASPPDARALRFADVITLLGRRIDLLIALPHRSLVSLAAAQRLRAIAPEAPERELASSGA